MDFKLLKTFSILIACSFLFIACENMPCEGENCLEQDSFMVERNDLLDRLHASLMDYDLDAPVDIVFEHCTNDDLHSINDLVDCNETPDALDCNDVEPVTDVCQRVVTAFIPQKAQEVAEADANCWTVGSWFPATACAPSTDRAVCGRGWGVYTNQARCCMAGEGAFDAGCTLTHNVTKEIPQVDALPFEKGDSRETGTQGLICGVGTTEVDGACMSDVRCGPDTIFRDGICISDVISCSGPDVFATPDGQCRTAVRAFTEEHCGEGTALIHGVCRSIVDEFSAERCGAGTALIHGECRSIVPEFHFKRCAKGTIYNGESCQVDAELLVTCDQGMKLEKGVCVAIPGAISSENCGRGTKLGAGNVCVAIPQDPVVITKVVEAFDRCVIDRVRNNMAVTLRGEGSSKRAQFACDAGFELVGQREIQCGKDVDASGNSHLRWNGSAPQCVAIVPTCGAPAAGSTPSCFPNCDYAGFDATAWEGGWSKSMEAGYLGANCGSNTACLQGQAYKNFACGQ